MNPIIEALTIIFWSLFGLALFVGVNATIASTVKQIITHYYAAKLTYDVMLLDASNKMTNSSGSFTEVLQQIVKKAQEATKGGV
jgi:hypothetical protein